MTLKSNQLSQAIHPQLFKLVHKRYSTGDIIFSVFVTNDNCAFKHSLLKQLQPVKSQALLQYRETLNIRVALRAKCCTI